MLCLPVFTATVSVKLRTIINQKQAQTWSRQVIMQVVFFLETRGEKVIDQLMWRDPCLELQ